MDISLLHFDVINSTSIYAANLLKSKETALPFAIYANQQTSGKGRLGRSWVSPRGNVYITFALALDDIHKKKIGLLPLKTACVLSNWIQSYFKVRPTIKWPNDILFGGKKLAGILCEGFSRGNEIRGYLLGIGLNLNVVPDVNDLEVTSLSEILNIKWDLDKIIKDLVHYWSGAWEKTSIDDTLNIYKKFVIEDGQFWKKGLTNLYYSQQKINEDGSLELKAEQKSNDPFVIKINSVFHEYSWIYQDPSCPIIVCDIGNTGSKFGFFKSLHDNVPEKIIYLDHKKNDFKKLLALKPLLNLDSSQLWPIHIGSVNSKGFNSLKKALNCDFSFINIPKRRLRSFGESYDFNNLGIDRLAAIEGYLSKNTGKATIIVNAGTATTMDFVLKSGEHLGGWIFLGLQSSLDCLYEKTDFLPKIDLNKYSSEHPFPSLGVNTEEAIIKGCQHMINSSIKQAIQLFKNNYDIDDIDIVITGGYLKYIDDSYIKIPELVLNGLKTMATGGA